MDLQKELQGVGVTWVVGVIFDPKGTKQTKFAWGIGISTNNEARDLKL